MNDAIIRWAGELQSLAQTGLFYSRDDYDTERYQRIREISAEMIAMKTGLTAEKVTGLFCNDVGYQTPKVDTRAAIFRDDKVLLVRERNGRWSIPGGWCEYNLSPVDNVIKEAREEAGLDVEVVRLIAVLDRSKHNTPQYIYGVVKIFYLCEAVGGEFQHNTETSESRYFGEDELPEMSQERCTAEQVKMCFEAYRAEDWAVKFD